MGSCISNPKKVHACQIASLIKIDDTWELKSRVVSLIIKLVLMCNKFESQFNLCIKTKNKASAFSYKLKQVLSERILAQVHSLLINFQQVKKKEYYKNEKILEKAKKIKSELTEFENFTLKIQNINDKEAEYKNYFDGKYVEIDKLKSDIECNLVNC